MAEEKDEPPKIWRSDRLPGFGIPSFFENHFALLNEKNEVVVVRSIEEWGEGFAEDKKRRVAATSLNGFWVSTVFLGINHDFLGTGPGIWFETMVFPEEDKNSALPEQICRMLEHMQRRYSTWAEAEAGHAAVVEMVRCGFF